MFPDLMGTFIEKAVDYAMRNFQGNIEPKEILVCVPVFEGIVAIIVAFA